MLLFNDFSYAKRMKNVPHRKCLFPYLYFKFAYLSNIVRELFPFKYPIKLSALICGGIYAGVCIAGVLFAKATRKRLRRQTAKPFQKIGNTSLLRQALSPDAAILCPLLIS